MTRALTQELDKKDWAQLAADGGSDPRKVPLCSQRLLLKPAVPPPPVGRGWGICWASGSQPELAWGHVARSETVVAVTMGVGKEVLLAFRGEEARNTDKCPTITAPSTKAFPAQRIDSAQVWESRWRPGRVWSAGWELGHLSSSGHHLLTYDVMTSWVTLPPTACDSVKLANLEIKEGTWMCSEWHTFKKKKKQKKYGRFKKDVLGNNAKPQVNL